MPAGPCTSGLQGYEHCQRAQERVSRRLRVFSVSLLLLFSHQSCPTLLQRRWCEERGSLTKAKTLPSLAPGCPHAQASTLTTKEPLVAPGPRGPGMLLTPPFLSQIFRSAQAFLLACLPCFSVPAHFLLLSA